LGEKLNGFTVALWGLAFKPETDDMREAPSRVIVRELLQRGANVVAYDPVAMDEARRVFGNDAIDIRFTDNPMAAIQGADALALVTEWKEFSSPDFDGIKKAMKTPLIFDGRNLYDPKTVKEAGLEYFGIGRR
jgi:UDPglucose 6-dehydrogenase